MISSSAEEPAVGSVLLFLTGDSLVAVRDPLGIRPLCLGRFGDVSAPGGTGYVIASETCALDVIGASFVCEIEPAEIVTIHADGLRSNRIPHSHARRAMCSFEFIYFARPDSVMMGTSLYEARREMGRELAREAPVDADIVITVPDSATPAAIGYAEQAQIQHRLTLDALGEQKAREEDDRCGQGHDDDA